MNALSHVRLSENFTAHEFRCKGKDEGRACCCHGAVLVDAELVSVVQMFREYMASPVAIRSAFRCDAYNEAVDGHVRSFHRVGKAADVTSIQIRKDLVTAAEALGAIVEDVVGVGAGNVIVYARRNFLHVDVGHRIGEELIRHK